MNDQQNIKAIETNYAGCRFRSRLEARWAVFFDTLGIAWEYEAQGYDIPHAGWYLPDFWLPAQELWVEVKGAISDQAELEKLIYASRYLPGATTGTYPTAGSNDGPATGGGLVVLGQIPLVREGWRGIVAIVSRQLAPGTAHQSTTGQLSGSSSTAS